MNLHELTKEQLNEEAFIDLAYALFEERREPLPFDALLAQLQKLLGLSEAEMKERLLRFYTDLNIDGRFLALGDGRWALREWYPVDKIAEETAPVVKTRKKKAKAKVQDDDEDEDLLAEDEEEDFDDVDEFDEDEEEDFDLDEEEEDEAEVDEDLDLDEELEIEDDDEEEEEEEEE
ncbi:DNA-directed RNA polymerase subunit delta [Bhargavaea cecembensis]|uniref:DNA-directed RNA polymerase subunit delta n=1 Tax=Bhargavaea cecembensis TaxID=394098 RepID=UPI00058BBAEA|nr:DNA-directed RNA polymerase subunit delta [Bhargavaea cecembensis]